MQISRLFRLLYLLLERERIPASELAQTLEVSVRTIYRDVQTLGEAGIPVYAERGRDGGIAILPTFRLNKSMLSAGEKQDMLSALQALASTGASDRETFGKLNAFFGGQQADWVRIDFADWSGTRSGMLPILKTAILNRQPLAFDYYNSGGDCAPREVCPIRLWFKSSAWYLLAYCMQRRALRTFKLTRIKRLRSIPGEFPTRRLPAWLTKRRKFNRTRLRFALRCASTRAWLSAFMTISRKTSFRRLKTAILSRMPRSCPANG